jgi:hypothetical protein
MGDDSKVAIEKLAATLAATGATVATTLAKVVPPAITVPAITMPAITVPAVATYSPMTERMREIEERSLQQMVDLPAAGAPKGPRPETAYLVEALKRRLGKAPAGTEPTPIAVDIFRALGFEGKQLKSKADHLVRHLKKT